MGDREAIGRTLTLASGLAMAVGAIIAVLFYIHSAGLLSLMGAPQEVMGLAVPYLRWRASAFPANLFLLVACGAFRYGLVWWWCDPRSAPFSLFPVECKGCSSGSDAPSVARILLVCMIACVG